MQQPAGLEAQEGVRVARAMVLATRVVACKKEGNGNSNKGNDDEGGGQW